MAVTPTSRIFAVFSEVMTWFTTSVTSISDMFYTTESGLTLLGTLTVLGMGIGAVLLIVNFIKGMIRFR